MLFLRRIVSIGEPGSHWRVPDLRAGQAGRLCSLIGQPLWWGALVGPLLALAAYLIGWTLKWGALVGSLLIMIDSLIG